jgi:phosphatidylinositol alpha 1,6-mannosyltransferase
MRIAFFPDAYNEVDGVANTSRHFEAFARNRAIPFLTVHAGSHKEIVTTDSVTRVQLPRGPLTFPLDQTHAYDLAFWRHYREVATIVQDFHPDVVQITGPSDVGMLGALIAHRLGVPLAANWQTNLHLYARSRLAPALSLLPESFSNRLLSAVERWTLRAALRFYKIPRLLFAPNREMVDLLGKSTGKPCFLMSHSVDTAIFAPEFRDREKGLFTIGYVGRLTAEKNVRVVAQIESALLARGNQNFRIVVVGDGAERKWLQENMRHAEFTGVLTGKDLSRAFANMDLFVFPSETDTFGLVVLEAFASGVPAVVSSAGGPKETVQHGQTGYVANNLEEFVAFIDRLLKQPDLLSSMGLAARAYALSTSWERIVEGMYQAYEQCFYGASDGASSPYTNEIAKAKYRAPAIKESTVVS